MADEEDIGRSLRFLRAARAWVTLLWSSFFLGLVTALLGYPLISLWAAGMALMTVGVWVIGFMAALRAFVGFLFPGVCRRRDFLLLLVLSVLPYLFQGQLVAMLKDRVHGPSGPLPELLRSICGRH